VVLNAGISRGCFPTFGYSVYFCRKTMIMIFEKIPVNAQRVDEELLKFANTPYYLPEKQLLTNSMAYLDLTTLEGSDTDQRVADLCKQARSYQDIGLPNVAAVCVYPNFAALARKSLKGSGIRTACVAGAFPSGQSYLDVRLLEVKMAVDAGADEIDMVISRGKYAMGEYSYVFDEIAAHKEACGSAHLKVILETGELDGLTSVFHASRIALNAGADFIKTSTGKIQPAATLPAFFVMLLALKEHFTSTGIRCGIKPAGGIAEPEEALKYLHVLHQTMGEEWCSPELFRIGASRLAKRLADRLIG